MKYGNFGQCEWHKIPMYEWQYGPPKKIKMMYKNLNDFLTEERYICIPNLGANTTNNNCLNIFFKATWVFCQGTRLTYFKKNLQLFFSKIITPLFVCLSVSLSISLPPQPDSLYEQLWTTSISCHLLQLMT